MKSPLAEADDSLQTLLVDGIRRAQHDAAAQLACASDDLARAVTAGAVAGAMAGAVAGASAAAATVHARQQFLDASLDRGALGARDGGATPATPVTPVSPPPRSPPPSTLPGGGEWARAFDAATKAYYYYDTRTLQTTWTAPPGWEAYLEGGDLARDLAQTSLDGSVGGAAPRRAEAAASSGSPPPLYARDTDIDTHEEVRQSRGGAAELELTVALCNRAGGPTRGRRAGGDEQRHVHGERPGSQRHAGQTQSGVCRG